MKAVILVGGEGTRMRPLTCAIPKPMLPLVNRPLLEHTVRYLRGFGIDHIILSMCYRPDAIKTYFGDGSLLGIHLTYEVEDTPLGTAGAVKNVERHLNAGPFFVFNGDIVTDLDLGAMLAFHRDRRAKATISLTPVDDPTAYGLVQTGAEGRVEQFLEKPTRDKVTTNMINAGTYILDPEVLEHVPLGHYMFERGLFPFLVQRGDPVYAYPSQAYWLDIGTPDKYLLAHQDVLRGRVAAVTPGVEVRPGVRMGRDCRCDQSAKLVPPVVLGDGVAIGPEAMVIGPASVHDQCRISGGAVIENAVIWQRTAIAARATVRDSIVGADCLIGEDSLIAEGAVIGDGVTIGRGNRLTQGIRIWPDRKIEPDTITF